MRELKDITNAAEELKTAIFSLKILKFKGCGVVCPKCRSIGYFGSVITYVTEKENQEYILCGWCGEITKKRMRQDR